MNTYHKIQTIFKRDMSNHGQLIEGQFSDPVIEFLKDNRWVFTEKVDGTNIRVMWDGQEITFGGKTDNAQIPATLFKKLQDLFKNRESDFKEMFEEEGGVCLYGEGYGVKIQSGGNYIPDGVDFVLFDIKIGDWWLKREDIEDIAQKLGLKVVPIINEGTISDMIEMTKQGFNSRWGDFIAEGIVARPSVEIRDRRGHRIITKIKYKDFH